MHPLAALAPVSNTVLGKPEAKSEMARDESLPSFTEMVSDQDAGAEEHAPAETEIVTEVVEIESQLSALPDGHVGREDQTSGKLETPKDGSAAVVQSTEAQDLLEQALHEPQAVEKPVEFKPTVAVQPDQLVAIPAGPLAKAVAADQEQKAEVGKNEKPGTIEAPSPANLGEAIKGAEPVLPETQGKASLDADARQFGTQDAPVRQSANVAPTKGETGVDTIPVSSKDFPVHGAGTNQTTGKDEPVHPGSYALHERISEFANAKDAGAQLAERPKPAPATALSQPAVIDAVENQSTSTRVETQFEIEIASERAIEPLRDKAAALTSTAAPLTHPKPVAANILEQFNLALRKTSQGGFEIQLDPVELGKIKLQLTPSEVGQRVLVSVERPEVLELLRKNEDLLSRELANHGFEGADLEFSQGSFGSENTPDNDTSEEAVVAARVRSDNATILPLNIEASSQDGLDIRL